MRPRCIMKPVKAPDAVTNDDRAALLVDADARTGLTFAYQVATANRRAEQRTCVLFDNHFAGHHVFRTGPADAAGDMHVGTIDDAATEVTEAAFKVEIEAIQNTNTERMLGTRDFEP